MSNQTSLVTEAARSAASQNTADYTSSIAAHIAGDWGKHNQVAVYDQPFETLAVASDGTNAQHSVTGAECLRFLVTIADVNVAIIVPGIPLGSFVGGGTDSGGFGATAPEFTTQPVGAALLAGASVTLLVVATGTTPLIYQWTHNGTPIDGATFASLAIVNFTSVAAGNYVCVATNSVGQTTSDTAVLSLRTSSTTTTPSREGVSG